MAGNKKISQLVDGGTGQAGDNFVIERGGVNFKVDNSSVSGNPGGLLLNGIVNDFIVKDEKDEVALEQRITLPAALEFVDNTAVPPTEADTDIYLLDDTGASNAAWDGNAANSWVRFDGLSGTWKGISAIDGFLCTLVDSGNTRVFKPTSSTWEVLGGAGTPAGANTEIQFNNAGAFGASSLFTFDTGFGIFSCNAAAIFNEGGTDQDFRIEGLSNPNMFFVDAGNDRVGIGTAAPSSVFEIDEGVASQAVRFGTGFGVGGGTIGYGMQFKRTGDIFKGEIFAQTNASGDENLGYNAVGGHQFYVNGSPVMRIRLTGRRVGIGLGTTAPEERLEVKSDDNQITSTHSCIHGTVTQSTAARTYTGVSGISNGLGASSVNVGLFGSASGAGDNVQLRLATPTLEFDVLDAVTAGATESGAVTITIGGTTMHLRAFATI